jgi:phospholipid/cholesterol/gamma-HCH transport system substrate-binding protein
MYDMKKELRWSKLKVGVVITLALSTVVAAVFFAGNIEDLFSRKVEIKIKFQDVKGLRQGGPVWLFGTEIGSVKKIHLGRDLGAAVTLSISRSAARFVKKDSEASILTMGLLGDKYVELSTGTPDAPPIRRGEMIQGKAQVEFSDIVQTTAVAVGEMGNFMIKLEAFLAKIEKGEGTIAKFLSDPAIYDNLDKTTRTLYVVLEDIKNSQGTLKMLIEDPSLYHRMVTAASSMEDFTQKLNESSGTLKKLVEDPSLYNKMLAATSSLEEFSKNLETKPGTLKRLIEDPTLYDKTLGAVSWLEGFSKRLEEGSGTLKKLVEDKELYENLNKAAAGLSSILERVEQGKGVAGTLIKDEELARELKETIAELKALTKDIKEHPKRYFKFSVF